ncbi:carboxylesterase family protein [Rhodococcus aerolatus]
MDPVVTVAQGRLRGSEQDGVASFKGVPFAAPPFGEHRFAAPAPPAPWEGERDATAYGPTAPKPPYPRPVDALLVEPEIPGEDCLTLNVWTPDPTASLPVLVWVHGGAFVNGSGAVSVYDGTAFARDGVVCVTINYRLGVDGFALLDGAPANRGLLDQVAALEWVRDNVAAFGGDPAAVTVAGESAGAMSVTTLLTMPRARGLFHRAIAQSGAGQHVISADTARRVSAALAEDLGVAASASALAQVPVADLVAAQARLSARIATQPDPTVWGEIATNLMAWEPAVDGDVVPGVPLERIGDGVGADVAVLTGTNTDEHALFLVPSGIAPVVGEELLPVALGLLGADPTAVVATYREAVPAATPGELLTAALTDWFFRVPAVRVAEVRAGAAASTHVYEFAWRSPQFDGALGACHALEVPFAFDTLADPGNAPLAGQDPPQAVADAVHGAWVAFVRDGDPGWPVYGDDRAVMRFDLTSEVVLDPRAAERQVWDGVR